MNALVPEIRIAATDSSVPTTELLSKALSAAILLDKESIKKWLSYEMNGYEGISTFEQLPKYRWIKGEVKCVHYRFGEKPIIFPSEEAHRKASLAPVTNSISELEDLIKNASSLHLYFPEEIQRQLYPGNQYNEGAKAVLEITSSKIKHLLDQVRTTILIWASDLEKNGILGAGMSFTAEEKKAVMTMHDNRLFVSVMGNGNQLQLQSPTAIQTMENTIDLTALTTLVQTIEKTIEQLGLTKTKLEEASADLASLKIQLNSTNPKIPVIKQLGASLRNIFEGTVAGITANLATGTTFDTLLNYINQLKQLGF
jgi:hypothetical protein